MRFLIVGLGNIGEEYRLTRHNVGFMVVERLLGRMGLLASPDRYAATAEGRHRGKILNFVMPSTYMNLSGKAVRFHRDKYDLPLGQILVITDDLSLPFGAVRLRPKGSDGGHNGLKSIQELLGSDAYPRLRIGIGSDFPKGAQADYVLSPFSAEESEKLPELLDFCADAVLSFAVAGLSQTMSQFNRK